MTTTQVERPPARQQGRRGSIESDGAKSARDAAAAAAYAFIFMRRQMPPAATPPRCARRYFDMRKSAPCAICFDFVTPPPLFRYA